MPEKKKTVGKSFTVAPETLKEMLVDAKNLTDGNFSKFILQIYKDWKKGNSIPDEETKKAVDFYNRFHDNAEILEYAKQYGFGDVYSLFTLALSVFLEKNK